MALLQITVVPLGTATTSVGDHVAAMQRMLAAEEIPFRLHDMGTIIEGEIPRLLELAARLHEIPFAGGAQRVMTQIVIDDRRDRRIALGDKQAAVRRRLA